MSVAEAHRELGVDAGASGTGNAVRRSLFILASFAGVVTGTAFLALMTPLALLAWPALHLAYRRSAEGGTAEGAPASR